MKIAVTGPRGFIAKRFITKLTAQKHEVITIDRGMSGAKLNAFFEAENPDVVIHLATHFAKGIDGVDIQKLCDSNLTFTAELLEYSSLSGVKQFIGFGTYHQFPEPSSLYAATKAAAEPMFNFYAAQKKISITEVYLYDTYGPNDPRDKILNHLVRASKTGESLDLSPGEQRLKLLHVDDVITAILSAMESAPGAKSTPQRFSVEPLEALTLKEVVQCVERAAGKKINARWGAREYTPGTPMNPQIPHPPLPGFKAQTTLEQGLVEMLKS